MSDKTALAVPLARLFARPQPEGPGVKELHAAELAAARTAASAEARSELAPRIRALEAELASERAARATEAAERACLADETLSALNRSLAGAVAPLALAVARAVLAAEPGWSEATLSALLAEALAGAADGDGGILRLHPMHMAVAPAAPPGWRMVADPGLPPGAVLAEAGPCLSLASLDLRLRQAGEQLEQQP